MNTENQNNNQVSMTNHSLSSNGIPNNNGAVSTNPLQTNNQTVNVGDSQQQVSNVVYPTQNGMVSNNGGVPAYQNQSQTQASIPQQSLQSNVMNVSAQQSSVVNNQQQVSVGNNVSNNSEVASSTIVLGQGQNVSPVAVPPAPVPPKEMNSNGNTNTNTNTEVLSDGKEKEQHEVVEVLTSAFDKKEKVNLLTPEQKNALTKKREEALKEKASYQPVPVSKFKRVMSILVIVMLFAIVFFLPDINNYIAEMKNPTKKVDNTPITTGTLKCSLDKVDDKYNLSYSYDFDFTNSKLDQLSYVQATTGDELVDYDELNQRLGSCTKLKEMAGGLAGIKIVCSLSGGVLTEQQIINYKTLNHEQVTTAYTEAGGIFPEFASDTSIDMIERNMKASGYTCERVK